MVDSAIGSFSDGPSVDSNNRRESMDTPERQSSRIDRAHACVGHGDLFDGSDSDDIHMQRTKDMRIMGNASDTESILLGGNASSESTDGKVELHFNSIPTRYYAQNDGGGTNSEQRSGWEEERAQMISTCLEMNVSPYQSELKKTWRCGAVTVI